MMEMLSEEKRELKTAAWAARTGCSAIQGMLAVANRPDVISFALGLPAAELFPVQEFAGAARLALEADPFALQYGLPNKRLKRHVVGLMARRGVRCREEQILLTTGAQQGVNLLVRLLLDHGGSVLCEDHVYSGFTQTVEPYEPTIITVPTDASTGIDLDAVERALATSRPALIYVITDGHNPLCVSLSAGKRRRLVALAREYGVPIIEDDPYGFICYDEEGEEERPAPLRALDDEWVFYAGTFSKILAPAVRVGWVIAPESLMPQLSVIKESSDINTSTFSQHAVAAYLDAGGLEAHASKLRSEYRARRDAMLDALGEHFPHGSSWRKPAHGFFVWVELPEAVDMTALLKSAVETEGVAFIPGEAFAVRPTDEPSRGMRLNFSNNSPERIAQGIARLGRAVRRALGDGVGNLALSATGEGVR
jgi:2-aminoadipate transaminase